MREVTVTKSELLAKVKANRESHIKEYLEACEGYKEKAIKKVEEVFGDLKARIESLRKGEAIALVGVHFGLQVPESHQKDYDQLIVMLEMSVDDKIELRSEEFSQYVMDDWSWKEHFTASNMMYKKA